MPRPLSAGFSPLQCWFRPKASANSCAILQTDRDPSPGRSACSEPTVLMASGAHSHGFMNR
jgi:hypothetical protein